ncbi:hypothetical protein WN51_13648 [Melipona quadrifasciata]|uniref:Uncharacterized protein n=1 Tax=Melipona quadrifasciata TaxID=166423 RepID=A0A0N1ITI4_9HYME|nr:hypothetical protein WN51_13648 [Melipona quadrifasciata]
MRLPSGWKIAHGMTGGRRPCERRECIKQRDDVTSGALLRLSVDNRSLIYLEWSHTVPGCVETVYLTFLC